MLLAVFQSGFRCPRGALVLYAALAWCGIAARADTGFTFKHVPTAIGSADILGYAVWTAPLGTVSLNGNDIPLRLDFTTDKRPPPFASPLGRGWSLPFFASALVEESQTVMRWHRPDGRIFYFARERGNQATTPSKPGDSIEFISTEASWRAVKDPRKRSVVISHITNGTELVYEDGRLVRFRFSRPGESADSYVIYYNRLGRPLRMSSFTTGKALVEFAYENAALAKSISIGDKTISLKFDEFPLAQFPTGPYLSEVGEGSLMPLKITYKTVGAKVNSARFERMADSGGNTGLSWSAATGFITEDDGGKYKIENPSLASGGRVVDDPKKPVASVNGVLPYNWRPDEAKVTHTDRKGKSQYRYFDRSKGVSTNRDKDGVTKVVYFMQAQGVLMNKVRKIEEIRGGKVKILQRNAYNELGNLVRNVDQTGSVTIHEYLDNNNYVRISKDGEVINEIFYANGIKVKEKEYQERGIKQTEWLSENGVEHVIVSLDKAVILDTKTQFDKQGRRKRYEQSNPPYAYEYEYTENGHSEKVWRDGLFIATDYYSPDKKRIRSDYANGQSDEWVYAENESLLITKSQQGDIVSVSRLVDSKYLVSSGTYKDWKKIIEDFTKRFPASGEHITQFISME